MSQEPPKKRPSSKKPATLDDLVAAAELAESPPLSADPFRNPPGIPRSSRQNLDAFVDAAELAESRWMAAMTRLIDRISDEVPPEAQRRAYRVAQQLNILWQSLWAHQCWLPLNVKTPRQLARWCRLQRRLLPRARGIDGFDWRTAEHVCREGVAAVTRAMANHKSTIARVWLKFPDLFDADESGGPAEAATARADAAPELLAPSARLVSAAWRHLRRIAGDIGRSFPPERTCVATEAEARSALDEIENWCLACPNLPRSAQPISDMDIMREAIRRLGTTARPPNRTS